MSDFVSQLLAKHHDRWSFRCGAAELDDYLQHRASQDVRRRAAAVFVLVPEDQPQRIAGFYSLSSASIILDEVPAELAKALPRYPLVPAVLLGRLARDVSFPGVGRLLLLDALARSLRHAEQVAAAVVLVDAKNKNARQFYAKYGFQAVAPDSRRMFLPMRTVATGGEWLSVGDLGAVQGQDLESRQPQKMHQPCVGDLGVLK